MSTCLVCQIGAWLSILRRLEVDQNKLPRQVFKIKSTYWYKKNNTFLVTMATICKLHYFTAGFPYLINSKLKQQPYLKNIPTSPSTLKLSVVFLLKFTRFNKIFYCISLNHYSYFFLCILVSFGPCNLPLYLHGDLGAI